VSAEIQKFLDVMSGGRNLKSFELLEYLLASSPKSVYRPNLYMFIVTGARTHIFDQDLDVVNGDRIVLFFSVPFSNQS
jgi:hypothetical protein